MPPSDDPRKYVQIANDMLRQIINGVLEPGDVVTITELTEEHKVARQTARRAIREIESRGLIAGYGTAGFVVTKKCPTCGQQRPQGRLEPMTSQEEELVGQILQKLDDQGTLIAEYCESIRMQLASIDTKLARIGSMRASTYVIRHGTPSSRAGRRCATAWARQGRRCHGPWGI
jgi:DNA-binding transcriptional regulator YhcF (GntR family)